MSALGGVNIAFNGLILAVRQLLDEWKPGELNSEREYQESLLDFLQQILPGCIVRKDYPEAGALIDIYLKRPGFFGDDEVFFELKHNLSTKSEFTRLIGQIMELEPKKRKVVVVLCGKTERSMIQRLEEHFKEQFNEGYNPLMPGWNAEPHMTIILK